MGIGSRISKLASQGAGGLASRGLTSIGDGRVLPGRSGVLGDPTPVDHPTDQDLSAGTPMSIPAAAQLFRWSSRPGNGRLRTATGGA